MFFNSVANTKIIYIVIIIVMPVYIAISIQKTLLEHQNVVGS